MLLNKDRALALMAEHDLTAIIGTNLENVTYLTGHVGWAQRVYRSRRSCALMTADPGAGTDLILDRGDNTYFAAYGGYPERVYSYGGRPAIVIPEGYEPADEEQKVYMELTESGGRHKTILEALLAALKARGITRGRIALDEEGCPPALFETFQKALPGCEFIPGSNLFLMIRLVKTLDELDRLRAAAQINEDAIGQVFENLRPGMSENDAAAIWRENVARPGGMWHWFHFNSGPRSCNIFPPTDRKLEKGDLFMFDAGLFFRNYNADTGSCGSIGEPGEKARKEWRAIETGFMESLKVIKEGCTGQQIFRALRDGIRGAGMPEFNASFAGHTVGLEAREFPFILADEAKSDQPFLPSSSEIPLPENAVINIEAPVGTMGFGGYQIEYSAVAKKGGWEPLIPQDRHFRIINA